MAGMFLHVEERQAWVRTCTHTVVYDRDPDYARFSKDPSGSVKRLVRIWLAEPCADHLRLRAYLGTVTFCFKGPFFHDFCRLFHLTSRAAKSAGQSAGGLRRDLANMLRRYIREQYGS